MIGRILLHPGIGSGSASPAKPESLSKRLGRIPAFKRLFKARELTLLSRMPVLAALDAYVGPIAGDKNFSRRMSALGHTVWVLESIQRISEAKDETSARELFGNRGFGGLSEAAGEIVELNHVFQKLSDKEKRVLFIAALLHDIGKSTGSRERHTTAGLDIFRTDPSIMRAAQKALSPYLTDFDIHEAEFLFECVISDHDLIGGIGITREQNFFAAVREILRSSPDRDLRLKMLFFLALINFADIDGQGRDGIFTEAKLRSFFRTYSEMRALIENTKNRDIDKIESIMTEGKNSAWWGKQRALAWCRGDIPEENDHSIEKMIHRLIPDQEARRTVYFELGKITTFDRMYNLATAIHDPATTLKFLIFIATIVNSFDVRLISYDNAFLTVPTIGQRIRETASKGSSFYDIFDLTFITNDTQTLRLSLA